MEQIASTIDRNLNILIHNSENGIQSHTHSGSAQHHSKNSLHNRLVVPSTEYNIFHLSHSFFANFRIERGIALSAFQYISLSSKVTSFCFLPVYIFFAIENRIIRHITVSLGCYSLQAYLAVTSAFVIS